MDHITIGQGIALMLLTVGLMEGVAYVGHRWIMHGPLWSLHRSHHSPRTGVFEVNDWFAVMGALPAIALIFMGSQLAMGLWLMWVGIGITVYGMIYFGFHDVIVHRRVTHGWVPKSRYMKRIVQAHRLHHVVETKAGTVSFGFIYAPPVRELLAKLERNGGGRLRSATATASSKVRRATDPATATSARG
jgi:beta-carotene 3-hydroxylase